MCFLLLASSHTASLVCLAPALPSLYDVFSLCLGVGQGMSLSVCLMFLSSFPTSVYLPLSVLHVSLFLLVVCLPLLSSHSLPKSLPIRFYFASFALCLCVFTCNCLYFGLKFAVLFYFAFWIVTFLCSLFICLWVYTCFLLHFEFFSVRSELHFQSVLSCMCTVFSRPQWRTS